MSQRSWVRVPLPPPENRCHHGHWSARLPKHVFGTAWYNVPRARHARPWNVPNAVLASWTHGVSAAFSRLPSAGRVARAEVMTRSQTDLEPHMRGRGPLGCHRPETVALTRWVRFPLRRHCVVWLARQWTWAGPDKRPTISSSVPLCKKV